MFVLAFDLSSIQFRLRLQIHRQATRLVHHIGFQGTTPFLSNEENNVEKNGERRKLTWKRTNKEQTKKGERKG